MSAQSVRQAEQTSREGLGIEGEKSMRESGTALGLKGASLKEEKEQASHGSLATCCVSVARSSSVVVENVCFTEEHMVHGE